MADQSLAGAVRRLRRDVAQVELATATDALLVDRFLQQQDTIALIIILHRIERRKKCRCHRTTIWGC